MQNNHLLIKVNEILELCHKYHVKIRTIESCTGGALAHLFTQLPGSSEHFDRGIIAYSNEAKHELLDIPIDLIEEHGAVSHAIATYMAESLSDSDIVSISTTGVLGPKSDKKNTKIGTTYIGVNICGGRTMVRKCIFGGLRNSNHQQVLETTLDFILPFLKNKMP